MIIEGLLMVSPLIAMGVWLMWFAWTYEREREKQAMQTVEMMNAPAERLAERLWTAKVESGQVALRKMIAEREVKE